MTILHTRSDPYFTAHLRSVLAADANAHPHSVDITVGYFYSPASRKSPTSWPPAPAKSASSSAAPTAPP